MFNHSFFLSNYSRIYFLLHFVSIWRRVRGGDNRLAWRGWVEYPAAWGEVVLLSLVQREQSNNGEPQPDPELGETTQ